MAESRPLNILVVDDEPAIVRTLSGFLRLRGYRCQTECDPRAALGRTETGEETFHVILTDLVMPGMDGIELVRRLRQAESMAQLIVMTAFSTLDRAVEAYHLGVSDYLLKPFESLDQVATVVQEAEARFQRWRAALTKTLREAGGE